MIPMVSLLVFLPIAALFVAMAVALVVFLIVRARNIVAFLTIAGLMLFGLVLLVGIGWTRVSIQQQHAYAVAAEQEAVARMYAAQAQGQMVSGPSIPMPNDASVVVSPMPPVPPIPPAEWTQPAPHVSVQPLASPTPSTPAPVAENKTVHESQGVQEEWPNQAQETPASEGAASENLFADAAAEQEVVAAGEAAAVAVETITEEAAASQEVAEVAEETNASGAVASESTETPTTDAPATEAVPADAATADVTNTDASATASPPAAESPQPSTEVPPVAAQAPAEATQATAESTPAATDAPAAETQVTETQAAEAPAADAEVPVEVKQEDLAPLQTQSNPVDPVLTPPGNPSETGGTSSDVSSAAAAPSTAATLAAPSWVENPPHEINGHRADVLISEPFEVRSDCERDLNQKITDSIYHFASDIAAQHQRFLPRTARMNPDIASMVRREQYAKVHSSSVGDMQVVYQLIVFDENAQQRIDEWVRAEGVQESLKKTVGISGMALSMLAGVFGIFRLAARRSPDPLSI